VPKTWRRLGELDPYFCFPLNLWTNTNNAAKLLFGSLAIPNLQLLAWRQFRFHGNQSAVGVNDKRMRVFR
jgi:hypothetical protein